MLDDDTYVAADNHSNMYVVRRNAESAADEERARLQVGCTRLGGERRRPVLSCREWEALRWHRRGAGLRGERCLSLTSNSKPCGCWMDQWEQSTSVANRRLCQGVRTRTQLHGQAHWQAWWCGGALHLERLAAVSCVCAEQGPAPLNHSTCNSCLSPVPSFSALLRHLFSFHTSCRCYMLPARVRPLPGGGRIPHRLLHQPLPPRLPSHAPPGRIFRPATGGGSGGHGCGSLRWRRGWRRRRPTSATPAVRHDGWATGRHGAAATATVRPLVKAAGETSVRR